MSKTAQTLECEKAIFEVSRAKKLGIYGCFEATIGESYGNERVDYLTMDSQGEFHCYEIKVSKRDFYSRAKKSFYGHYNYFVFPLSLYHSLLEENNVLLDGYLGAGVGIYTVDQGIATLAKRAKRQTNSKVFLAREMLMYAMIRSLSKYTKYEWRSENGTI